MEEQSSISRSPSAGSRVLSLEWTTEVPSGQINVGGQSSRWLLAGREQQPCDGKETTREMFCRYVPRYINSE